MLSSFWNRNRSPFTLTGDFVRRPPLVGTAWAVIGALLLANVAGVNPAPAAEPDDIAARIANTPPVWRETVHRLTQPEYEATLQYWGERHPNSLTVQRRGVSSNGLRIHRLRISDHSVADDDKQTCLITSLHGGPERSGTTTILHLAEWLLGDSPAAIETRKRQIVLLMPINNPEAFFVSDRFGNFHGIDPYTGGGLKNWDLESMTFKAFDRAPEVKAFLSVVDEFRPEVPADVHGIGLQEYPVENNWVIVGGTTA